MPALATPMLIAERNACGVCVWYDGEKGESG